MRHPWLALPLALLVPLACSSAKTTTFSAVEPKNPKVAITKKDLATYCAATQDANRAVRDSATLGLDLAAERLQSDKELLDELALRLKGRTRQLVQGVAASVQTFADQAAHGTFPLTPPNLAAFIDAINFMPGCGGL
jgi:hypothetical protein